MRFEGNDDDEDTNDLDDSISVRTSVNDGENLINISWSVIAGSSRVILKWRTLFPETPPKPHQSLTPPERLQGSWPLIG